MAPIRVLVVDDSLTMRRHLVEIIGADAGMQVVGEAVDGRQAIEMCHQLRPDVLTLDLALPVMNGLTVTEQIMAHCPTPILIVSGSHSRGELFQTYEALAAGAVEVLDKPREDRGDDGWERTLVAMVKLVSRIKVITHLRGRQSRAVPWPAPRAEDGGATAARSGRLVAIGTSTGGPGALAAVLQGLPPTFPLPILAVIHIGEPFAKAFAEWLDQQSPLRVSQVRDGEPLPTGGGRVLLAPADRHLVVRDQRLRLIDDPPRHSCRPSVDVLFESLAGMGDRCTACLLTGMGRDGARGLLAIREAGGVTIAQDEATSVVFGMPREAIQLGAAAHILPLERVAPMLIRLAGEGNR